MNTNPGTGVDNNFFSSIRNFFSSIKKSITNSNALNYSIHTGAWGVPYATMGLVTIVAGTLTYVTYSDYVSDTGDDEASEDDGAAEGDDGEKSDSPFGLGMFGSQPSDEAALDAPSATEEQSSPKNENMTALNEQEESSPKTEDLEKKDEETMLKPDESEKKTDEAAMPKQDESEKKAEKPNEEQYTLGGKTRGNRKKYLKRKTSKRKIRR
jgi:hypothetical protein